MRGGFIGTKATARRKNSLRLSGFDPSRPTATLGVPFVLGIAARDLDGFSKHGPIVEKLVNCARERSTIAGGKQDPG